MDNSIVDFLVALIASIVSFDFMHKGWLMLRYKKKIILWPLKLSFSLISIIFGSEFARKKEEIHLTRVWYYEISAFIGGLLGFVGGVIWVVYWLVNTILRLVS